jgi:hypothetical protein
LESFQDTVKEKVLLLGGTTFDKYHQRANLGVDGYDPVDKLILKASLELENRYIRVFWLFYEGQGPEEVRDTLIRRKRKPISVATIDRYRGYTQNRIVEIIKDSPDLMKGLTAAIEE